MKEIRLHSGEICLVDSKDFEILKKFKWRLQSGYSCRSIIIDGKWRTMSMHREIMGVPVGFSVDHINHDTLDNRRDNLRICTHKENLRNRSIQKNNTTGFRGVVKYPKNRFLAKIRCDGKWIHIGLFTDIKQAALAYNAKAEQLFGEYACLNVII